MPKRIAEHKRSNLKDYKLVWTFKDQRYVLGILYRIYTKDRNNFTINITLSEVIRCMNNQSNDTKICHLIDCLHNRDNLIYIV